MLHGARGQGEPGGPELPVEVAACSGLKHLEMRVPREVLRGSVSKVKRPQARQSMAWTRGGH